MRTLVAVILLVACSLGQSVAGLKWTTPSGWKAEEGERPMRAATYIVAPVSGDTANAECVIYFFGAGQGGSVESNLARWKGQIIGPDGKPAEAKITKRTVHDLPVTTIDSSGDYAGMGGPMAASKAVHNNYRLLGAIIEGPVGNVFLKFTGPAKTIGASQSDFEKLVSSFEKEK